MHEKVRKIFSQILGIPQEQVNGETSPDTVATWDSLKHLNLVAALEEEFGVQFDDMEVVDCTSPSMAEEILKLRKALDR